MLAPSIKPGSDSIVACAIGSMESKNTCTIISQLLIICCCGIFSHNSIDFAKDVEEE